MKVLGVFIAILALLIAAVPQFTSCESQGRALVLEDGRQVPMRCHWTARAELVTAAPLLAIGLMTTFSRRKESKACMGILGLILGVLVVLLPTGLIGVCMNAEMLCNSVMKPFLILTGGMVIVIGLAITAFTTLTEKTSTLSASQPT
jgi:hypothetical protein